MTRCRVRWVSVMYGPVQCVHLLEGHPRLHQYWPSRKVRRRSPNRASWIVVGLSGHPRIEDAP